MGLSRMTRLWQATRPMGQVQNSQERERRSGECVLTGLIP